MSNRLRIYSIGTCTGLSDALATLVGHEAIELIGRSGTLTDAGPALSGAALDALLYAVETPAVPADALAAIREHTSAPVVLVSPSDCSEILDKALEAGVADVVEIPRDNVYFAIRKICSQTRREKEPRRGRVVTVFCPKGGVGKTTASVNLASALAKVHEQRVLMLDLDLQFGDTAIMLGLEPQKTIYDLMVAPGELDVDKLAGYVSRHASGVDVLPAPLQPEEADLVTEQKLVQLIEVAREAYDLIVVDTAPFFHGPMLATLDRTDELLLLCGVDVPTIKNVRLGMNTLDLLRFPRDRVRIVLNRPGGKGGVGRHDVESVLEGKVRFELPNDQNVLQWVNQGKPIVLADAKTPYSRAILQLARALAGPTAGERRPRGRLLARA